MRKLFTLIGALLLWHTAAVAQNYLHIWTGDTTKIVRLAELDSVTIRDRVFYGYDWVSLGVGLYRESLVGDLFGVDNIVYEVEIETIPEQPGMYRLVCPYCAAYPYNSVGDYDTSKKHYMEIDAQDPTAVYIKKFYSGMDWGYGEFVFWSMAGYYLSQGSTLEEIKAAGYCGTLKDGVITFPAGSLIISMTNYNNGALYSANGKGKFAIALPGYAIPEDASNAPAIRETAKAQEVKDMDFIQHAPMLKKQETGNSPLQLMKMPTDAIIK